MINKQKLLDIAELIDAYRMIPRILLLSVAYLVWDTIEWYKLLDNPTSQQSALITTVTAIIPFVINFYLSSGRKWQDKDKDKE